MLKHNQDVTTKVVDMCVQAIGGLKGGEPVLLRTPVKFVKICSEWALKSKSAMEALMTAKLPVLAPQCDRGLHPSSELSGSESQQSISCPESIW